MAFGRLGGFDPLVDIEALANIRIMKDLDEVAGAVEDEQSFIAFLDVLADDFPLRWEHCEVDSVFEAAAAWGESSSPRWKAGGDQNPWRRCAQILLGGKYYE